MKIAQITRRAVITIDQGESLAAAARLMRHHHVGLLVVTTATDGPPQVAGVVTDRDLAIEVLARDLGPGDVRVGQIAARHLVAVDADAGVADALALMKQHGVRRLLVTEAEGRLAGVVAVDDLVEALAGELNLLAQALRSEVERETRERAAIPAPAATPVFLPAGTPGMRWPAMGS